MWRTYGQRVLTAAGRVPQTRAKTRTGSQSDLPHRRVVPVQSVHQLHREPISAVGKEKGSRKVSLSFWLGTVPERTGATWVQRGVGWIQGPVCVCIGELHVQWVW